MSEFTKEFSMSDLPSNATVHMIGIGGISMSALASMLIHFGYKVTGSDRQKTDLTDELEAKGAKITVNQSAGDIGNPQLVCYTAAVADDNPELVAAKKANIPTIERAELLGAVMELYKHPIAVAGTHGKTTTTSMLSLILLAADTDPTILVGGKLPQIGGNLRIGKRDYLPFEACEYVESFLHFKPYMSIITNVEEDHLDYFSGLKHIISSFEKFARLTSPLGCIIVCSDDKNVCQVVQNVDRKIVKFAICDPNADYRAENIRYDKDGNGEFDLIINSKNTENTENKISIKLNVPGEHNIKNALAAAAAADVLGIDAKSIQKGLLDFGGTKRRFEHIGSINGCEIIDDYAHHPTEITATLKGAKEMGKNNVWVVFQPHTYSRTKAFLEDFAKALSIGDKVMICDVYPARESYDGTVHSCDLAQLIPGAVYMNDVKAAERYLKDNVKEGDMLITMGAGDVFKIGYRLAGKPMHD